MSKVIEADLDLKNGLAQVFTSYFGAMTFTKEQIEEQILYNKTCEVLGNISEPAADEI